MINDQDWFEFYLGLSIETFQDGTFECKFYINTPNQQRTQQLQKNVTIVN